MKEQTPPGPGHQSPEAKGQLHQPWEGPGRGWAQRSCLRSYGGDLGSHTESEPWGPCCRSHVTEGRQGDMQKRRERVGIRVRSCWGHGVHSVGGGHARGHDLRWPPHLGHGIRGHLPWTGSPVANGRCAAPAGVQVSPECTGTGACAWDEGPSPTATRTGSAWCSLSSCPLLAHMLPCPKPRRSPPKAARIVAGVGRGPQGARVLHMLVTELTRVTACSACP